MKIVKAEIHDHEILTAITKKSKGYWGFAENILREWEYLLTITPDYIEKNQVYKLVQNGQVIGYYGYFSIDENTIKLDNLFILPEFIGKGYGRVLINDCIKNIHQSGMSRITLDAEPNAEIFYKKFGFETIGQLASSINDRFLPIMELQIGNTSKSDDFSLASAISGQMVDIPRGTIELRDDRTKEKWMVEIEPFLLSKFPVTQNLYAEITGENPSFFKGGLLPVESVTFRDAVVFCNQLSVQYKLTPCYLITDQEIIFDQSADGFRLPTEAEWEYACKAGTAAIRYGQLDLIAWYKDNSDGKTHHVGEKEPNPWGLYDMLGNVWEWCSDLYDTEVYGSYRIFRGGGYFDVERSVMATTRRRSHPLKFKIEDLGFRIAKNK